MKYTLTAFAIISGVLAQDPPTSLPVCAATCVTKFISGTEIAGCKQADIGCVCENTDFLDQIACCLVDVCNADEQKAAVAYAGSICEGAGVDVPDEVVCKGAASPSASSTETSSSGGDSTETGSSDSSGANSTSSGDSSNSQPSDVKPGSAAVTGVSMVGLVAAVFAGVAML